MIGLKSTLSALCFVILTFSALAQHHNITIQITNQPPTEIILGSIKGDKFTSVDTTLADDNTIQFQIKSNSPGIYRIILGQTSYARIMHEAPQQFDFIYNNEDVSLKTDFKYPADSLKVIKSEENKLWYDFLEKEKILKGQIKLAEKEMDYYWVKKDTSNAITKANEFNQLQMDRELFIKETVNNSAGSYAAKMIKMYSEPFRDGYLSTDQRNDYFKANYFKGLDFKDESLMNSPAYTDKVFNYLVSYNNKGFTQQQREAEYEKAIDIIVANTNRNEKVYEFILNYMVGGFELLKMDNLITYIADKYSGTTCQTDEVSTLERRLLQQKMKIGTVVPDFTLNDVNGDAVTLKDVLKDKNLILFWASWCPHCNEMIPQILRWQKSLNINDFEVIAISLDDVEKDWKDKVYEFGIESWYNLSSLKKWDCPAVLKYNVYATPTLFILDRERKIIGKPLTMIELRSMMPK